ncbi:MAG: hypothetical protein QW035_01135 [Candidatus Anstonellales archaeon]
MKGEKNKRVFKEERGEQRSLFHRLKGLIEERLEARLEARKDALMRKFKSANNKEKERILERMVSKKKLWDLRIIEIGLQDKEARNSSSLALLKMIEKGFQKSSAISYFTEASFVSDNSRKKAAIYALGLIGGSKEAAMLVDFLGYFDYSIKFQARDSLLEIAIRGEDVSGATSKIIAMLSSGDHEKAKAAILGLGAIGDEGHLHLLLPALGSSNTRWLAEESLACMLNRGIGTSRICRLFKNMLREEAGNDLQPTLALLKDYIKRDGKVASFALGVLKEHFYSDYMEALKKKDPARYNRESIRVSRVLDYVKEEKKRKAQKEKENGDG